MNNHYALSHIEIHKGLYKSVGLSKQNEVLKTKFPNIFTSFAFRVKTVKEAVGVDSFVLNQMLAVLSYINVNVLIGLKDKFINRKTFSYYMKADDHPYFVVVEAIIISLMIGRAKSKKEIVAFIKTLKLAMSPYLANVIRVHNQYEVTQEMVNMAYSELRTCRSNTTKPSSILRVDPSKVEVVEDINDFFRDLIKETRLIQGMIKKRP